MIGDVHGCAGKLEGLLREMGYELISGAYRHPERRAIFVGDLVDRGDEQMRTLEVVKAMVDAGSAQMVMGNHEFNAISYATPDPDVPGEYLRPHTEHNRDTHKKFLEQVPVDTTDYAQWIGWFTTLPLWLELDGLRVVHACWNEEALGVVREWDGRGQLLSIEFLIEANREGTPEHDAIEVLLKGPEIDLRRYGQPDFQIPGDRVRHEARIRWWDSDAHTVRELAEIEPGTLTASGQPYPELPDTPCKHSEDRYDYGAEEPVLFFGHYWRKWKRGSLPEEWTDWTANTACLDFSAVKDGEPLVAYRWSGESEINPENYVAGLEEPPYRYRH